jgi:hypothetical protein
MQYSVYPIKDATIYDKKPDTNTGLDQIIELEKISSKTIDSDNVYWGDNYNSRILLQIDTTEINKLIQNGTIKKSSKYYLNLFSAQSENLSLSYSIYAYPISQSWNQGRGYYNSSPPIKEGVSWTYRDGYFGMTGKQWASGSFVAGTTGSYLTKKGGGNWYYQSGFVASQSFDQESPDLRMDITNIVHKWISGSIQNNGLIIKRSNNDEKSSEEMGSIKFFGRETHTIFIPRLDIVWNDADFSGTSLFSQVPNEDFILHFKNKKASYYSTDKTKFRFLVRDRIPVKTYSTSSNYITSKRLPTSSYYAIQDEQTSMYVVPFDDRNVISCDNKGNYFRVNFNTFLPNRYYKVLIKVKMDGGDIEKTIDDSIYFKVSK